MQIGVEGLYGGDAVALCKATQCPILLMPAGNDAADYDKGGNLFEALPEGTVRVPLDMICGAWQIFLQHPPA